jgi:hypothetical protein
MVRALAVALVVAALCAVPTAGAAAAPIHPSAKQVRALNALTADVTRLVAMTRTIAQGVEVPETQIVALRATFRRWNAANRTLFGARLAPATALGRQGVVVLNAIEKVERVGDAASRARIATAVTAFNARVVAFSRLPFA